MKNVIAILAVLSLAAFAGQIAVNPGTIQGTDGDVLSYDNGSPHWVLSGGGFYKGTWFNVEDFIPNGIGATLNNAEFWFYHHTNSPWDTSDIYLEVWNGDPMAVGAQLNQTMVTALHYAPVFIDFTADPLEVEANFWLISNTELSAEGIPSTLSDWAGAEIPHSFVSEDLIIWEPYPIGGLNVNFFIRTDADIIVDEAFDNTTWGSLKATF